MAKWNSSGNLGKIALVGGVAVMGVWLLRRHTHRAYQGFLGPQMSGPGFTSGGFAASPDVPTANCTPAGYAGSNQAMYCNPPGQECGFGQTCADARVNYCQRYAPGGVCMDNGQVAADQGLPGQGPIVSSGAGDIQNIYGFGSPQVQAAMQNPYLTGGGFASTPTSQATPYGYAPSISSYGYGFANLSGSGYPPSPYGYGMGMPPQMPYGYPSMGFGMMPPSPMMGMGMGMGYPSYGYGMQMPMPSPYGYY